MNDVIVAPVNQYVDVTMIVEAVNYVTALFVHQVVVPTRIVPNSCRVSINNVSTHVPFQLLAERMHSAVPIIM